MVIKNKKNITNQRIMDALKEHKDILKKYRVKKIGLFGSHAMGKQKRQSDIDFLVEFTEPTFDNFMALILSLEKLFARKIDLITNGNLSPYILPYVEKEVRWYEV